MVDVEIPKHTVIQYVRDKKRVPYGVLVAVKSGLGFTCGYSLCNKKDRFNKRLALKIALGRAHEDSIQTLSSNGPHDIRKVFPEFFNRCVKYYKV